MREGAGGMCVRVEWGGGAEGENGESRTEIEDRKRHYSAWRKRKDKNRGRRDRLMAEEGL